MDFLTMPRRRHVKHKLPFTKAQVHVIEKLAKKEIEEEVPVRYQLKIITDGSLDVNGTSYMSLENIYNGPTADVTKMGLIDTAGGVQYIQLNPYTDSNMNLLCAPANGYERSKLKYLHFKSMIDCGTSEASCVRIEVLQYLDVPTDVAFTPYYPNIIPTSSASATPNAITLSSMSALAPDVSWLTAPAARDFGLKYRWLHRETLYFDSVQNYAFRPFEFKLTEKHLGKRAEQIFDELHTVKQNKNPIYLIVYSLQRNANNVLGTLMWQPSTARLSGNYLTYLFQDLNK